MNILPKTKNSGFTLFEVVAALVIIGILSAIAMASGNVIKQSELHTFAAALKANIGYTKSSAMTTESICALVFNGNSYKFQDENNTDRILPGQNQILITAPSDVTVLTGSTTISFDSWGRPGTDKTDIDKDGLLDVTAASSITISNSEKSITLNITKETGYITQ